MGKEARRQVMVGPLLTELVVVNESDSVWEPGDVSLFRDRLRAEAYIEPVDVENGEYFAFTGNGRTLKLRTDGQRCFMETDERAFEDPERVRIFLRRAVERQTGRDAGGMTVEELIAEIGFS